MELKNTLISCMVHNRQQAHTVIACYIFEDQFSSEAPHCGLSFLFN